MQTGKKARNSHRGYSHAGSAAHMGAKSDKPHQRGVTEYAGGKAAYASFSEQQETGQKGKAKSK